MEINSNNPPAQPPSAAQLKATALSLQVGQTLRAVVVESVQNSVKLRIDDTVLQAPTTRRHAAGEALLLTVVRAGEKPVLRVRSQLPSNAATSQATQESALKLALPKQMPLTLLLANLNAATQLKGQLAGVLPLAVSESIKKLLNSLADSQQIKNPAIFKQAILNSGLLLEQKLSRLLPPSSQQQPQEGPHRSSSATPTASSPATLLQDFKGNLLQLLDALKQGATTTELTSRQSQLHQALQSGTGILPGTLPQNKTGTQSLQQSLQLALKESTSRTLSRTETIATTDDGETPRHTSSLRGLPAAFTTRPAPFPFLHHMPLIAQKREQATLPMMQFREQIIDELIRQIEGAVSRIQLSQLASLPQENAPQQPTWVVELPLRHGESVNVVQMRVEKEKPQEGEEQEARWRVTLTLNLDEIGTIYAQIAIQGESSATTLWAETAETVTLIEENLTTLRSAIEQHGVSTGEICCRHGTPPQPPRAQRHTLLVDTKV